MSFPHCENTQIGSTSSLAPIGQTVITKTETGPINWKTAVRSQLSNRLVVPVQSTEMLVKPITGNWFSDEMKVDVDGGGIKENMYRKKV